MKAQVPVPGSITNGVVVVSGDAAKCGLRKLHNVGRFGVAIAGMDAAGNILGVNNDSVHLFLPAGASRSVFFPPSNAVKIIVIGEKTDDASGVAELEFELPWECQPIA